MIKPYYYSQVFASDNGRALLNCCRCRRLANQFSKLRRDYPEYWNRPVPGAGLIDINKARILILGLAPGLHGANKTGKPFVGDASGDLLHSTLAELELEDKVFITNAVKCLPIKNLPNGREVKNCSVHLVKELEVYIKQERPVVFVLGGVAHKAVIAALGLRQADYPFGHGLVHMLPRLSLVNSFHCSRYNTQTGRLTPKMFRKALAKAKSLATT